MEQRFGFDFSRVRVHTDAVAERSARDVNAHAYTVGHNMVFGAGRFAPGTHEGRRLLAHEMTHLVQQSGVDQVSADQSNEKHGVPTISPISTSGPRSSARVQPAGAGSPHRLEPRLSAQMPGSTNRSLSWLTAGRATTAVAYSAFPLEDMVRQIVALVNASACIGRLWSGITARPRFNHR
jgi:hypothetical protein